MKKKPDPIFDKVDWTELERFFDEDFKRGIAPNLDKIFKKEVG